MKSKGLVNAKVHAVIIHQNTNTSGTAGGPVVMVMKNCLCLYTNSCSASITLDNNNDVLTDF